MQLKRVLLLLSIIGALVPVEKTAQAQAFLDTDWVMDRANNMRHGANNDPGLASGDQLAQAWVWPPTADLPAEIVVDNGVPPNFNYTTSTGQSFTTVGSPWVYPLNSQRAPDAWPPVGPTVVNNNPNQSKAGDYVHTAPTFDATLRRIYNQIGREAFYRLPNLPSDEIDPNDTATPKRTLYKQIHDALVADTRYARWSFGTQYPTGTVQGTVNVGGQRLIPGQRYAVFIHHPSSGTIFENIARPNTANVMVRVSWGADVNDPVTSRIFVMDFSKTGGWQRVRSILGEDRYFPYDGVNPIRVTIYSVTPDQLNEYGTTGSRIVADAVRLVPEAMRGDIRHAAVSAVFPPGTSLTTPGSKQLTFFGRDETVGPPIVTNVNQADQVSIGGFQQIPFNPTLPPQPDKTKPNYNPYIPDPTSSIRTAVFYCFEDDLANRRFGRLRWRHVARPGATTSVTVDDGAASPSFTATSGFTSVPDATGTEQSYAAGFRIVTPNNTVTQSAIWQAPLSNTPPGVSYTVFVWIPAGDPSRNFAHRAHYVVTTDRGDVDVYLDQRNTLDTAGVPRVGTWRRLIAGVRFPPGTFGGNPVAALGKVTLHNDSPTDVGTGRVIAADAVLFMADSSISNGVAGAPLLANVKWPSGTIRSVVYFPTTDGHLWALDAIGASPLNGPPTSTLTTAYWVYPSISNPEKGLASIDAKDDPNLNPDPFNNQTDQGIDGDLEKTQVNGQDVFTPVRTTPRLGAFSSPIYVEVKRGDVRIPYIVAGNANGRVYAFDPAGRVDPNTNEPYAVTFAVGDNPGIPGTTRRLMTWPTTARDAYLAAGGGDENVFRRFAALDQQYKGAFVAAPAAPTLDANFLTDRIIIGAGLRDGVADGHVYAIDMQNLDPRERISNRSNNAAPRWQYPNAQTALEPIEEPCVLTGTDKVVFSAGHRVYMINNPNTAANGLAVLQGIYPFTSKPPGNPTAADKPGYDDIFTAPIWRESVPGLNGGQEVIFVASRDGTIFAFDATQTGGQELPVLWHSQRMPSARASAVFLRSLTRQPGFVGAGIGTPAVLLPNDAGVLNGYDAVLGTRIWTMPDASNVGQVPVQNEDGNTILINITSAWRGADAITANGWVYQGDEGNQDAGEHNGQMRAYASSSQVGLLTPGEPPLEAENRQVDIRLVNLWNTSSDTPPGPWDSFGIQPASSAKSPFHEINNIRPNTQGNITIYEWGDSISVAAWGAYTGTQLPTVTFRLYSGPTTRPPVTVGARPDLAYSGPPLFIDGQPAQPWVAKARLPLRTGNDTDPQTPGSRYTVFASARITGAFVVSTRELAAGQDYTQPDTSQPRRMAVAHPLTLTTRGPSATSAVGAAFPNIIGWMNNAPPDNLSGDLSEVLSNGNAITDVSSFSITGSKDLVAPLGFVSHGASGFYLGVDNTGKQVPALFLADRSNMYKVNQPLTNVRVERGDLAWGWNPNDSAQQLTGNVMNPLPWEEFPNRVPNSSADYPNLDRSRAVLRGNGIDMALQGITLPPATLVGGNKRLNPVGIDLQVNVPPYQPANINTAYFDITGALNPGLPNGLLAPMLTTTGRPPTSGSGLEGLLAPSAGYYGKVVVYIDSNNNGLYQGSASGVPSNQQTATTAREEVYRQFQVGIAVPPDVSLRTEEETLDLGKMPHGGGYDPTTPFAPSFIGPYAGGLSPWDTPGLTTFFRPFTLKNTGNVNLVNLRIAKIIGTMGASPADPTFWSRLMSDQVEPNATLAFVGGQWRTTLPSPPIWAVPFNFLSAQGGVGNMGIVSSLDHLNSSPIPNWDHNFWPYVVPSSPAGDYVQAGNPLGWAVGTRPRPTLHKPRPNDPAPTVLSIPDVAHGDPLGLLSALGRDTRPKIGIAVPLGTPAGTYSAPVYVFEDHTPEQWRAWQQFYGQISGQGSGSAALAQDDNGLLDTQTGPQRVPVEAYTNPTFTLKVEVGEARLTNGVTPGSYFQIDRRAVDQPPFGANLQPAALRDRLSGNLLLFWASNRPSSTGPAPASADTPWFLNFTQLNAATGMGGPNQDVPIFDWRYEPSGSRWWNPLPSQPQFPSLNLASQLFPAQASDVNGNPVPVIAGYLQPNTMRFASPALAQDQTDPASPPWLFFQGMAIKSGGTNTQSYTTDTRTFYTPVQNGVPNPPGGIPYSFLNDPAQPKYAPKPIILTDVNGRRKTLLFWYGGAKGRTRLYYNAHIGDLSNVNGWSRDTVLPTPGALQWQSDPYPIHRRIFTTLFNPNGEVRDVIDLAYTGVLRGRKQAETLLTRYAIMDNLDSNGNVTSIHLRVVPLPTVENELLAREGVSQTWSARDIAWVYRDAATRQLTFTDPVDGKEKALFSIFVNYDRSRPATDPVNQPINLIQRDSSGRLISPIFDEATGQLIFASALGGRIIVDPQAGTVTFPDVAPRASDAVTATYTPQAMRLNVTRDDVSLALDPTTRTYAPAAWVRDAGFAPRPHVVAPGSNTGPVAFIDRALNPRVDFILPGLNGRPSLVTRMWTFYRKTDSSAPTASNIYYKTMRLMVRLPRSVLREANGDVRSHVRISGNRGPVEIDWVRGRLYFNEEDEGNIVTVSFDYARDAQGQVLSVPPLRYRVTWGDEITTATQPGDQTTTETVLPTSSAVNEGQISAFKDPFQDKVWVFWSSTRAGTSDLYFMAISPQFYTQPGL